MIGELAQLVEMDIEYQYFLGSKMDKTDDNRLTNQPETVTIPSPILSRVMGCWDAGEFGQMLNLLRDHTCTDMRINIFQQ